DGRGTRWSDLAAECRRWFAGAGCRRRVGAERGAGGGAHGRVGGRGGWGRGGGAAGGGGGRGRRGGARRPRRGRPRGAPAGGGGAEFHVADATGRLPFADESFDAVLCNDAINHLRDRGAVLAEWRRLLRARGRVAYTDPVVVSGPLDSREISLRASIGSFVF